MNKSLNWSKTSWPLVASSGSTYFWSHFQNQNKSLDESKIKSIWLLKHKFSFKLFSNKNFTIKVHKNTLFNHEYHTKSNISSLFKCNIYIFFYFRPKKLYSVFLFVNCHMEDMQAVRSCPKRPCRDCPGHVRSTNMEETYSS